MSSGEDSGIRNCRTVPTSVDDVRQDQPKSLNLHALFSDPSMFDSRSAWRRAGFDVLDPAKDIECMVASHQSAPGCLFKRYKNRVSQTEQSANYQTRIAGAARLARFIAEERLQHIVVPQKHLHELPKKFGADLLVVECMDIVGTEASERCYHDIAEPVLRELLRVLVKFRGLDSNSKNVQFTHEGKIAFVDLENWKRADRKEVHLKSIGQYLSKERFKLARRILDELR